MALEQIKSITSKEWLWKGNEKLRKKDIEKFRKILEAEKAQLNILSGALITPRTGKQFTIWDDPKKMKNGGKKLWVVKVDEEAEILEVVKVKWQFRFKVSFGDAGKEGWMYPQLWDGTPIFEIVEQEETEEPQKRDRVIPPVVTEVEKPKVFLEGNVINDEKEKFDILSPGWEKLPESIKVVKKQWGDEIRAYLVWKLLIQLTKNIQPDGTIIFEDKEKKYFYNPKENTITKIEDIKKDTVIIKPKGNREEVGDHKALEFLKSIAPGIEKVEDLNGKEFEFEWLKFKWSLQNKWEESKIFFEETNSKLWIAFIVAKGSPIVLKWSVITSPLATHEWLKDAFILGTTVQHLKSFIAFSQRISGFTTEEKHAINNLLKEGISIDWKNVKLEVEEIIEFIANYNPQESLKILEIFSSKPKIVESLKVWLWIPTLIGNSVYVGDEKTKLLYIINKKTVLVSWPKNLIRVFDITSTSKEPLTVEPAFTNENEPTVHTIKSEGNAFSMLRVNGTFIITDTPKSFLFFKSIVKVGETYELVWTDGSSTFVYDIQTGTIKEKLTWSEETPTILPKIIWKLTIADWEIIEVWEAKDITFKIRNIDGLLLSYIIATSDEGTTFQLFTNTQNEWLKKFWKPFSNGAEINIDSETYIFDATKNTLVKKEAPKKIPELLKAGTTLTENNFSWYTVLQDEKPQTKIILKNAEGKIKVVKRDTNTFVEEKSDEVSLWEYTSIKIWESSTILVDKEKKLVVFETWEKKDFDFSNIQKLWDFLVFKTSWEKTSFFLDIKTWKKYEFVWEKILKGTSKKYIVSKEIGGDFQLMNLEWGNIVLEKELGGKERTLWIPKEKDGRRIILTKESWVAAIVMLDKKTWTLIDIIKIEILSLLVFWDFAILESVDGTKWIWEVTTLWPVKSDKINVFLSILQDKKIKTSEIENSKKRYYKIEFIGTNDFCIFDTQQKDFISIWESIVFSWEIKVKDSSFSLGNPPKEYSLNTTFLTETWASNWEEVFKTEGMTIVKKWEKFIANGEEVMFEKVWETHMKIFSKDRTTFTVYEIKNGKFSATPFIGKESMTSDFIFYKNAPILVQKNTIDWFEFVSFIEDGRANILLRDGSGFILWEIDITDDTQIQFKSPKGEITIKVIVKWENISMSKI